MFLAFKTAERASESDVRAALAVFKPDPLTGYRLASREVLPLRSGQWRLVLKYEPKAR